MPCSYDTKMSARPTARCETGALTIPLVPRPAPQSGSTVTIVTLTGPHAALIGAGEAGSGSTRAHVRRLKVICRRVGYPRAVGRCAPN